SRGSAFSRTVIREDLPALPARPSRLVRQALQEPGNAGTANARSWFPGRSLAKIAPPLKAPISGGA
ncbi:hypothetical protein, partial [Serratia marcescens]|uniref:hypothetical protein n=1 Tax=Serratia marcescens TaxID=615 RepID=UPI001953EA16